MGTVIFTIILIVYLNMRPVASGGASSTQEREARGKVKPCENFYKYVCDKWMKTAVPRGVANWTQLEEGTTPAKHKIAEYLGKPVKNEDIYPVKWAKVHFQACMNERALNENGVRPLANIVNSVNDFGWNILGRSTENNWVAVHNSYCRLTGEGALLTVEVGPDENFERNVLIISPTKELFLRHISKSNQEDIRQYVEFLTGIWTAYTKEQGYPTYSPKEIKNAIQDVLTFRREIIEKRNLIQRTSRMDVMTLSNLNEHTRRNMNNTTLDWPRFLQSTFQNLGNIKFNESTVVHIRQFNYVKIILRAIEAAPVKVLLNHIHLHFLERFIQHTSPAMNVLFHHVLKRPIPKRSITCITSNAMKKIVNYIYVRKFLTNDDIRPAIKVVRRVRKILKGQISRTRWIVKEAACLQRKLDKMKSVVGYDSWYANKTNVINYYSRIRISENYFTNILNFETMSYTDALRKLGTPIIEELNKPSTDPLDLSATYNYQTNKIVIPAALFHWAILDEPYMFDDLYGGLGTTAGYVMSRSLDSLGRQYDEMGNRGNWWSKHTLNAYNTRLRCYSKRFKEATLRAKVNFTVDRKDYLNEIVAEYMGLVAAFEAYQNVLCRAEIPPVLNYENEREVFFVTYARRHCEAVSAHFLDEMGTDAHLPHELRVNTALSNMQAFADTFRCKENDPMNSSEKCEWLDESFIRNVE